MSDTRTIVIVLQARTGSTRLPGKVIAEIKGRPMLAIIIERLRSSHITQQIIVATTDSPDDDVVCETARQCGAAVFRGSEDDVLDRYYKAAIEFGADVIVRLTADNPFVDGPFVDNALKQFLSAEPALDYVDTTSSGGYPKGLSLQIVTMNALHRTWELDDEPASREHVLPYVRSHQELFRCMFLAPNDALPDVRMTVDVPDDLAQARRVFECFDDALFTWQDAVRAASRLIETTRQITPTGAITFST